MSLHPRWSRLCEVQPPRFPPDFIPPRPLPDGVAIVSGQLLVFRHVRWAGEPIGTIYLKSDLSELRVRDERFIGIIAVVILASFVLAYLTAGRLQRVISDPILELARTAFAVSIDRDYSLRATKRSQDEIGFLFDRFNEMLAQVQERDVASCRHGTDSKHASMYEPPSCRMKSSNEDEHRNLSMSRKDFSADAGFPFVPHRYPERDRHHHCDQ